MADVVKSRKIDPVKVAENLKLLATTANKKFTKKILSPLTITLGDEFQGIPADLASGIEIIIYIEELGLEKNAGFKLRYVLVNGEIETPVNKKIAYGMLGKGLTKARETINYLKKDEGRFFFFSENNKNDLNKLFMLYQSIVDDWKPKDLKIVSDFIKFDDYKIVAGLNNKSLSLMWKRKRSLKIKEYKIIKELINDRYGVE
jgi:SatD family (SatD)